MEESTKMTIEFLRARLLSERSVSRAARQRADQLAKRVLELDDKLRFISIQRKKAEKAAEDVLSILETQGIRDLSEEIDSSSEEEDIFCDKKLKEYESSITSRLERSEVEISFSGSEPELSNSQGKSLSWKSHSKSPDSSESQISRELRQRQRRRSFSSTLQFSPKQRFGKSCRKIKPIDIGSEADSEKHKFGVECSSNCDDLHDEYGDDHNEQSGGDKVMERILDHQAELICQFQAEEIAQRDWEDKFNKNIPSVDHEPVRKSSSTAATNSFAKEFNPAEEYYKSAKEMSGMMRNKMQNEAVHQDEYRSKSKSYPGKNEAETSKKLGDVLEALQFAKLSLSLELSTLPSSDENKSATAAKRLQAMSDAAVNIDIPIDSAALFRLPTDTFPDVHLSMPNHPTAAYFERGSTNFR